MSKDFEELYSKFLVPVYRYCYLRLGSKEAAEDVAQIVFEKVFTAKAKYEDRGKSPLTYLFTIARNTIIDRLRRSEAIATDPQSPAFLNIADDSNSPKIPAIQREASQTIYRALQNISDEYRETLTLRYISELSYEEIAELLGKSQETIRQTVSRALRELRKQMPKSYG